MKVEVAAKAVLVDIVTERFDAGIRTGELVAAIRIGHDMRSAIVC